VRGDERLGGSIQRIGAGDQIGLVRFEEAEDGGKHGRLGRALAQIIGPQAGECEQSFGPCRLADRPGERAKCQSKGVVAYFVGTHRVHLRTNDFQERAVAKKVLVVEDNELNLKLFCDLLRAHEYDAEPVRDGREAVARAAAFQPDLIVMDIQLPHVSGLELIGQLKGDEALCKIPIMAVTAYAGKGDEDRIRGAGAEAYVSKPISVMRFIETVAGLIDPAPNQPGAVPGDA
jgi:two-component system cell cycle response regulator DivK